MTYACLYAAQIEQGSGTHPCSSPSLLLHLAPSPLLKSDACAHFLACSWRDLIWFCEGRGRPWRRSRGHQIIHGGLGGAPPVLVSSLAPPVQVSPSTSPHLDNPKSPLSYSPRPFSLPDPSSLEHQDVGLTTIDANGRHRPRHRRPHQLALPLPFHACLAALCGHVYSCMHMLTGIR